MIKAGIDLGADSIRLVTSEDGLVFDEACMVAFDQKGNVLAIGNEARDMKQSLDQEIQVVSPLAKETIDFYALHLLLEQLIYDFKLFRMFKKTILLFSYPTSLGEDECDQLKEHLLDLGAYRVYFDQEIWVASIGAKLNLFIPVASCLLNLGSSNCDIAVFSNGGMIKKSSYKAAGRHVDLLIKKWMHQQHSLLIDDETAQRIKLEIGQTRLSQRPRSMLVQGIHSRQQKLHSVSISENDLVPVLMPLCQQWAGWIYKFLMSLTPQQQEDVRMRGIICCGGTMLLPGLKETLQEMISCPIYVTDDPLNTVSQGLEDLLSRM